MKKIKKIAASIMAVAAMTTSLASFTASAQTIADNYSEFTWNKSGTSVSVSLKNTSGSQRRASVFIMGYDQYGNYAGSMGNENNINDGESVSASGNLYYSVKSASFSGTMYSTTLPYGTPLSNYYKTIG